MPVIAVLCLKGLRPHQFQTGILTVIDIGCRQQIASAQLPQTFRIDRIVLKIKAAFFDRIIAGAFRAEQIATIPPMVKAVFQIFTLVQLRCNDLPETVLVLQRIVI